MKRLIRHLICFPYIWVCIFLLFVAALFSLYNKWWVAWYIIWPTITAVVVLLIFRPLNAVYGLMGTTGSIRIFFVNFIFICIVFSFIYYFGFFKTAGVSYDVNQPHISYGLFSDSTATSAKIQLYNLIYKPSLTAKVESIDSSGRLEKIDIYENNGIKDSIIHRIFNSEEIVYQNIDYLTVLRNTILTFLMQEPTDLFELAANYNTKMSGKGQTIDKQKTEAFHCILILQILVGWIFFGVFISLLYNKFRYES